MIKSCRHLQSQTSHKNHGLFKDFAAPNEFFPGPFFSIDRDSNREKAVMNQTRGKKNHLSWSPGQVKFQAGQAYIFTQCPGDK